MRVISVCFGSLNPVLVMLQPDALGFVLAVLVGQSVPFQHNIPANRALNKFQHNVLVA